MALSSYINPVVFDLWDEAMRGEKKADAEPAVNSAEVYHRRLAAFGEFFESVSYVGGGRPIPATDEEIGDLDD
jgi:hypothetical protein